MAESWREVAELWIKAAPEMYPAANLEAKTETAKNAAPSDRRKS